MGRRGPPPLPSAVKKRRGTFQPCRAAKNEMAPPPGVPVCPRYLDKLARTEWARVVPELMALGVMAVLYGSTLEGYCANYSSAVRYQKLADKKPMTKTPFGEKANAASAEARKHWSLVKQFGDLLGLSPSSSSRVSMAKKPEPVDATEAFLFGSPKLVKGGAGGD